MAFLSKTIVFVVNVIFLLVGLGVLIFGIIVLAAPTTAINGLNQLPNIKGLEYIINVQQVLVTSGILLTVVGSVIVFICFVGLLGTCAEGKCMLATYVLLLVLTILFELGVIIWASVGYYSIQSKVQNLMLTSLHANFKPVNINNGGKVQNNTSPGAMAWESMQFEYACCGATGYEDYSLSGFDWSSGASYLNSSAMVPPSCCMQIEQYQVPSTIAQFVNLQSCMYDAPLYTNVQGCYVPMMEKIAANEYIVAVVFAGLVAVEVIVLMISMHLIGEREKVGVYA